MTSPSELPIFIHVSVILTEKEWKTLFDYSCKTDEGTISAAIREMLGWKEKPYGLRKAIKTGDCKWLSDSNYRSILRTREDNK